MSDKEVLANLRAQILYDPETGAFTRLSTGKSATSLHIAGYLTISFDGRNLLAHRVAWFYMTGEWPTHQIDHKDRDRKNNRFDNLREATNQQNSWNMSKPDRGLPRGVHIDSRTGRFMATARVDGKTKYLGRFDDANAASAAYQQAITIRGEFSEIGA